MKQERMREDMGRKCGNKGKTKENKTKPVLWKRFIRINLGKIDQKKKRGKNSKQN